MKIRSVILALFSAVTATAALCAPPPVPSHDEVIAAMVRANDRWQSANPGLTNASWSHAAYHTGNMAAYHATGKAEYLDFSHRWAEHNLWMGARSTDRSEWKFTHGGGNEYVLFGDWQTCFQVYADLYKIAPDERKIARAREVMEYQMSTPERGYWWWADGLYMAMPVMTRLYALTGNEQYLDKLSQYLAYADSLLYDRAAALYYRDTKYVYPAHRSANGGKDFWSRGNGWVLAGFARAMDDMPRDSQYRRHFEKRFRAMARAITRCQQPGGYWTRSMLDATFAPGPETSGTAFFTFGLLWGLNNGIIHGREYRTAALRGWRYLADTALQTDGFVGYVQPIGEKAIPGEELGPGSTANFGVGAFLLAADQMGKYSQKYYGKR